ncbi:MAG: hypothetical protein WAT22_01295 [Saprospiraceae bacterium]|nr:hypothetical protein [Saprospiraceae bacterium]MBP6448618.1 hypothetical protein [Saprospiraceae bacterium]
MVNIRCQGYAPYVSGANVFYKDDRATLLTRLVGVIYLQDHVSKASFVRRSF